MRVESGTGPPSPRPSVATLASPVPNAGGRATAQAPIEPRPVQTPAAHDRVEPRDATTRGSSDMSALDWAKREWPTVANVAHGLASTPGIVSKAWSDAATTNAQLSQGIRDSVDRWGQQLPSVRQNALDTLTTAATRAGSTTARSIANDLTQVNRFPLEVERAVNGAVGRLPAVAQHTVTQFARNVSHTLDKIPPAIAANARHGAHDLDVAAALQNAKASSWLPTVSRTIGHAAVDATEKAPLLGKVPVAGIVLTGLGIGLDVRAGKSVADATVANIAGTIAGTAAGIRVTQAMTGLVESAAISDGVAAGLGAAAATGPVGWVVAGGVVAGAAVGYGIYKAIESAPGQALIDGAVGGNRQSLDHGIDIVRADIGGTRDGIVRALSASSR